MAKAFQFWEMAEVSNDWIHRYTKIFVSEILVKVKSKYITVDDWDFNAFVNIGYNNSLASWSMIRRPGGDEVQSIIDTEIEYYKFKYEIETLAKDALSMENTLLRSVNAGLKDELLIHKILLYWTVFIWTIFCLYKASHGFLI